VRKQHPASRRVNTPWGCLAGDFPSRTEGGFTLIELLIVTVVLPIVVGGIAVALISVLSLQGSVSNRISDSADAQVVSSTFNTDVQDASMITVPTQGAGYIASNSPAPCETAIQNASSDPQVLGLQWGGGQTGVTQTEVSYVEVGNTLVRNVCLGAAGTPVTTVVSHNVQSGLNATVTCGSPSCTGALYSTSWVPAAGVSGVDLAVTEKAATTDNYVYSLTGVPRAWSPSSGNGAVGGLLPLLLLGTGSQDISCGGNLTVNGEVALDSQSNPAAATTGQGSISASSYYVAGSPSGALSGNITTPGAASATILSGPAITDPFAGLIPPDTSHLAVRAGSSYQGPGIYNAELDISSTVNFIPGTYVLNAGMHISNGIITSSGGGVFFYVTQGQVTIDGQTSFDLQPLSSPPSPAAGLVIWQVAADTQTIIVAGRGSVTEIEGIIYAPGALVSGAGNGNLKFGAIVSAGLACNGSPSQIGINGVG
jgi:prepilin-type N-terminal cleavage/methylation domain-containing protein